MNPFVPVRTSLNSFGVIRAVAAAAIAFMIVRDPISQQRSVPLILSSPSERFFLSKREVTSPLDFHKSDRSSSHVLSSDSHSSDGCSPGVHSGTYDIHSGIYDTHSGKQDLNLAFLAKAEFAAEAYRWNMERYIPLKGLPQNDDGRIVARKIGQRVMQNFLDEYGEKGKNAPAVAAASHLNQNMKAQIGGESHRVIFKLRPIEAIAEVSYSGVLPVTSKLSYEMEQSEMHFECARQIGRQTYAYTHSRDSLRSSDILGVRWGF